MQYDTFYIFFGILKSAFYGIWFNKIKPCMLKMPPQLLPNPMLFILL